MADYDAVREIGRSLPGVVESTSYGTPSLKLDGRRGKMIARLREDGETLVVRCPIPEREMLIEAEPEVFAVTDHYRNYDCVLINLVAADRELLDERLTEAWALVAPPKLLDELDRPSR